MDSLPRTEPAANPGTSSGHAAGRADVVAGILDRVTRGGRGSTWRAVAAALAGDVDPDAPLHRAFAAIAEGSRAINEGRYDEGLTAIIPALDELERSPYSRRLGWLHNMVGFAVGMMGSPERGLVWTGKAVAAIGADPPSVDSFAAFGNHGCLLGMVGAHEASRQALEESLAIAVARGDAGSEYIALANLAYGAIVRLQESPDMPAAERTALAATALRHAERASRLRPGPELGLDPAGTQTLLGQAMLHAGDVAGARARFAEALRVGPTQPPTLAGLHLGLAVAHRLDGDYATARIHLGIAYDVASAGALALLQNQILAEGVQLETAAADVGATLAWTTRRCEFLETHYRQRLTRVVRSTELATQADTISERASRYQVEAASLATRADEWDDDRLRDGLTRAFNRRGLARVAHHVFAPFRPLAVAVIDVDDFTALAAQHGSAAADAVLRQVAAVIGARLRSGDRFARAEGAEFQLLLLDTTPASARETCEAIRLAIERGAWIPDAPAARITVSIGLCNRTSEKTFEATLAAADVALEQARRAGCNRTAVA